MATPSMCGTGETAGLLTWPRCMPPAYETIPANLLLEIAYAYVTWGEVLSKSWETAKQGSWDNIRKGI